MRQAEHTQIAGIGRKVFYALQVSAHSGSGHPSDSAGRLLTCAWAASYRQSLLPGGHCSPPAACRPPPPAGTAALLIPYLSHRKRTQSREICLNITGRGSSIGSESLLHHYSINSYWIIKSNILSFGRWTHCSPHYPSVLFRDTLVEGSYALSTLCSIKV